MKQFKQQNDLPTPCSVGLGQMEMTMNYNGFHKNAHKIQLCTSQGVFKEFEYKNDNEQRNAWEAFKKQKYSGNLKRN